MDDYLLGNNLIPWKGGVAQTITFVITQECNLRCKYCYMTSKNKENIMSFETGRKAIDYFLTHNDLFTADAVILDFIGGEPLLEIDLIDSLVDYFKLKSYELNHKWFTSFRVSISTNGILYSTEKVQKFIKKNSNKLSIGISIDGTKEKNDLQRVYPNGKGTYDDIVRNVSLWKKQFPLATTKVTIGHDDLPYLKDSIIHLWELGLNEVPANVVFEDVWEEGDDILYYKQLHELADYIIDNDMWKEYNTTLFTQGIGYPLTKEERSKNSCGTGSMLAIDANGKFYPCVRFMDYSLNNQKGYVTGDIQNGINREKVRPFYALNFENLSDEECINCDIASGCQWCSGYNYDQSEDGSIFKRSKSICKMHKARIRANNYLWSRLTREKGITLKKYRTGRKYLFIMLADNCVTFCNYEGREIATSIISKEKLYEAEKYCFENFVTPVLVHSNDQQLSKTANEIFKELDYVNIYPYSNIGSICNRDIIFHTIKDIKDVKEKRTSCILKIQTDQLHLLAEGVKLALKFYERVNIQWQYDPNDIDLKLYHEQLTQISEEILKYYKEKQFKQVNLITDDLMNSDRNNCDFGFNNFVLAPNAKLYVCPAMYYENSSEYINELVELHFGEARKFNINKNPICSECDMKHCQWCFYISKKITNEYSVPGTIQCKKSQVERSATNYLYKLMNENGLGDYCKDYIEIDTSQDPLLQRESFSLSLLNFSYDVK